MKRKFKIVAIIALLAIVLVALNRGGVFKKIFHKNTVVLNNGAEHDIAGYMESLKTTDSDIEGMSVYDKIQAGLNPEDGADTDNDGLTDKEEIETYNSDPLKASTADDLYTDGYKIENGMDVNTHYDSDETASFPNNKCSEVTLNAETVTDLNAKVDNYIVDSINGYDVYDSYIIEGYTGELSIDVSDFETKDLCVLLTNWYGGDAKKISYSLDGSELTPKYSFAHDESKVLVLAKKNESFFFGNANVDITRRSAEYKAFGLVSYTFTSFGAYTPTIYYTASDDMESESKALYELQKYLVRDLVDAASLFSKDYPYEPEEVVMKCVSEAEYYTKLNTYKAMPFCAETAERCDEFGTHGMFLQVVPYSDFLKASQNTEYVDNKANIDFNVAEDTLPFNNFASEYISVGNCVGISHLTSTLYNTGRAADNGSYTSRKTGNKLSWNISGDPENLTLTDRGLSDYKDAGFTERHLSAKTFTNSQGSYTIDVLNAGLTDGEQEFVKMLGAYSQEGNRRLDAFFIAEQGFKTQIRYSGVTAYDYSLVENMIKRFDNGEILDAQFVYTDAEGNCFGHTFNLVGYTTKDEYEDTIIIYTYDNSFPGNLCDGEEIRPYMLIKKNEDNTFSYYYNPCDDPNYIFTSERGDQTPYAMVVYDNNWNVLNDMS